MFLSGRVSPASTCECVGNRLRSARVRACSFRPVPRIADLEALGPSRGVEPHDQLHGLVLEPAPAAVPLLLRHLLEIHLACATSLWVGALRAKSVGAVALNGPSKALEGKRPYLSNTAANPCF